jgi:hypothetical protein
MRDVGLEYREVLPPGQVAHPLYPAGPSERSQEEQVSLWSDGCGIDMEKNYFFFVFIAFVPFLALLLVPDNDFSSLPPYFLSS